MAHVDYEVDPPMLRDDWYIEDIYQQGPWLNEEQAIDVMEHITHGFDANIGISWDLIDFWISDLYPRPDDYVEPKDE